MRKIKAPGIQINEIDKSNYSSSIFSGTTVLIPGFTSKGDDYVPIQFSSMDEFIDTYGYPETLAEKYYYNAAKEVLNNGSLLIGAKLPYANNSLNHFAYTSYTVDDRPTDLVAPIDIINKTYGDKSLSSLFFLDIDGLNKESLSVDVSNISFIQDFNSWLSVNSLIDYSLLGVFNELFNSLYCFDNLDAIFELSGELDIDVPTEDIHFITNLELKNAIKDGIPENVSDIQTLNETRNKFIEFSHSFKSLFQTTDGDNTDSDISSDIVGDVSDDNVKKIYNKFLTAGLSSSNYIRNEFLRELSLENVKSYYKNYQSINELSAYLPEMSLISTDLELPFTSIKETFPNVKTFRRINSYKRYETSSSNKYYSGLMSIDELDQLLVGMHSHNLDENEIKIVDKTRQQYGRDKTMQDTDSRTNQYLGIVPIITTVANALYFQNILNSRDEFGPYNVVGNFSTINSFSAGNDMLDGITSGINCDIPLSSDDPTIETLGKSVVQFFPKVSWKTDDEVDTTYFNQICVIVCKMIVNSSAYNKISFSPVESFVGSFDREAVDPITNASIFIDDVINNNSKYIYFFSNIKNIDSSDMLVISNQTVTSLGFFESDCVKDISVDKSIFEGLDIIFNKLSDTNRIRIDLLVDAGMSDICHYIGTSCKNQVGIYEPNSNITGSYQYINSNTLYFWRNVINKYDVFCKDTRKDCMFICDAPRTFALEGNLQIVRKTKPQNTVENSILPKVRFLAGINTSYGAGYCNWFSIIDDITYASMWVPPTIKVLACYLRSNEWEAPAGIQRGRITGTYDLAFNPTHKESETLYENNWNYAISYPLSGIITEGQKTFQKNKTAFDRVNTRRTFLYIEKEVREISRGVLYERITDYEITRFRDRLTSFMDGVKYNNAIVDYYLICNDTNNTPHTIDNNEIHVSIGIKPTKVAEFIVLNFICTTQSADVMEVTSESI